MNRNKIKSLLLKTTFMSGLILLIPAGFLVSVLGKPETHVFFQSSDGNWRDNEVFFKGRDFDSVVFSFEVYKSSCGVKDVELQRITQKPGIFTLERWFNDYSEPKWLVPYHKTHPSIIDDPDFMGSRSPCRGVNIKDLKLIRRNTEEYILSLETASD